MKQHKNFLERIVIASDLDTEPIPGLPLVELTGTGRVLIENHLGVLQYSHSQISIKMRYGSLCVIGSCLELARMTKQQLVITGRIACIQLSNGR